MRCTFRPLVLIAFVTAAGCSASSHERVGGTGGSSPATGGSAGSGEGTGGAPVIPGSPGGSGGSGGTGSGTGGSSPDDAAPIVADAAVAPDADTTGSDGATAATDGYSLPAGDAGAGNYEGAIPPYEGPPVPPIVMMDCPGDPTQGFTEYKDTFLVEHPYDLPAAARFSIDGGIYTFWVMHGDKKHSPTSTAVNPRTEARYSQDFKTGIRMWSADVYWEKSVAAGTVVMQVHTTSTGIGPVYMVANGANVPPIDGSKVMGGLFDRWINMKVQIDADTTASQYWINNCPVAMMAKGTRGDGNDYFKMGVYHCDSGVCKDHYKNVHLYIKQ